MNLAGGTHSFEHAAFSDETIFKLLFVTHTLCAISGLVENYLERNRKCIILQSFFGSIVFNSLYLAMIFYAIFDKSYNKDEHNTDYDEDC